MNHIPVISTIDDSCDNLSLGSAASCASLNRLDGMVALTVYLKKVKEFFFFFFFFFFFIIIFII